MSNPTEPKTDCYKSTLWYRWKGNVIMILMALIPPLPSPSPLSIIGEKFIIIIVFIYGRRRVFFFKSKF